MTVKSGKISKEIKVRRKRWERDDEIHNESPGRRDRQRLWKNRSPGSRLGGKNTVASSQTTTAHAAASTCGLRLFPLI